MLFGEAPGYYVFITNIVKCRPPRNRDPLPQEVEACKPYLERQLALIDPPVVVTLGRFAMAYFLPEARISRVHGQPFRVGERWVVPMYHPAAGLYRESLRPLIEEDFRRLGEHLKRWLS